MRYDLSSSIPLHERYADIALRPIFKSEDDLLRLAIAFLDPTSPLVKEKNIEFRLEKSFELANLNEKESTRLRVESNDPMWDHIIFEYFRFIFNLRYEAWFSLVSSVHQLNQELRSVGIKPRERVLASQNMASLQTEIDKIELELFDDQGIKERLYQQAVLESLSGYAEKNALPPPSFNDN
jgi:hypothetical protein